MAHPIGFAQANQILGKGNHQNVSDLEVFSDGKDVVSKWQFTDEEMTELVRNGGKVYLLFIGNTHPPVAISTLDPWREG